MFLCFERVHFHKEGIAGEKVMVCCTASWEKSARVSGVSSAGIDGGNATRAARAADGAAAGLIRTGEVQLVIVGADRIAANGDSIGQFWHSS